MSSMEAEYRTIVYITIELYWIQSLLYELFVTLSDPPSIHYDNIRATYLCANPVFRSRMKRKAIDFHFIRGNGMLHVSHVSSSDQFVYALSMPFISPTIISTSIQDRYLRWEHHLAKTY